MPEITEMVDGIYRICSLRAGQSAPVGFNQFLIDDEPPTLIHTGYHNSYETVRAAVAEVLDPRRLAYVVLAHFEPDGLPRGRTQFGACRQRTRRYRQLGPLGYRGPVKGMRDGDVLDLGRHRLRFLETPHVHHWDSMMQYRCPPSAF